jgi:hypothetical protein
VIEGAEVKIVRALQLKYLGQGVRGGAFMRPKGVHDEGKLRLKGWASSGEMIWCCVRGKYSYPLQTARRIHSSNWIST